ncbi:uncharacterized protein [Spinacia oleracea]|uniref:Uncharacterized protein isoform X7 n=1 Tax=Spinacia oleracea TaxID=3562 RepID=A0ABM3RJR2_SPIOL|nr:uncharacterized protein LOC110792406 isoform X7 [Spinacia oleracea]
MAIAASDLSAVMSVRHVERRVPTADDPGSFTAFAKVEKSFQTGYFLCGPILLFWTYVRGDMDLTFNFLYLLSPGFLSVAHMPWHQMTYKFLNTIIDDLFAFVIKMPKLHRLSVFRDECSS